MTTLPSTPRATIAVAPNGGRLTRADHPAVPTTPAELARCARECLDAGAAMIHVHVRKPDGTHLLDADAYRAATAAIRDAVADRLMIQITTEALGLYTPAQQAEVLKAVRPEAASLALREFAPEGDQEAEAAFAELLGWMIRERVAPQIILYGPEEADRLGAMRARGLLPWNDVPVLYVLGRYTPGQKSSPVDLLPFLAPETPRFGHWSVCAFGERETACVTTGALLGGHARVGFENNRLLPDGTVAADNAALVRATAKAMSACGVATGNADHLRGDIAQLMG